MNLVLKNREDSKAPLNNVMAAMTFRLFHNRGGALAFGLRLVIARFSARIVAIALSDLMPVLSRKIGLGATLQQLVLILAGIATIALFHHGQ